MTVCVGSSVATARVVGNKVRMPASQPHTLNGNLCGRGELNVGE